MHTMSWKTDNILHRLINDREYTGGGPRSLSHLPENLQSTHMSTVDKALVSVFRRLNSNERPEKKSYAVNEIPCSQVDDSLDDPVPSAKRLRREYDGKPFDGLTLLLDLISSTVPSGPISRNDTAHDRMNTGLGSSRSRIIRNRRELSNLTSNNYSRRGRNISRNHDLGADDVDMGGRSDGITDENDFSTQVADRFIQFGGLSYVVSSLLLGTKQKPKFRRHSGDHLSDLIVENARKKQLCFDVLYKLCCLKPDTAKLIYNEAEPDVLVFCFHCLGSRFLKGSASRLIEVILMERPDTLNLCSIPMLKEVLNVLDDRERLSNLCRVLSITISDLDSGEQNKNLLSQNRQKRASINTNNTEYDQRIPIREMNQELIMNVPGLIRKILDLAVDETYFPRQANSQTEIDNWMRFIDDSISNEIGSQLIQEGPTSNQPLPSTSRGRQTSDSGDMFDSQLLAIMEQENTSDVGVGLTVLKSTIDAGMKVGNNLLSLVEALYVLSLLLIGKHRKQIQNELAEMEMIPRLSILMDRFVWKSNSGRNNRTWNIVEHFNECDCSPEVAVKIQFLRLIHSFCDQNPYKHLLLSPCELDELRRIKPLFSPVNSFHTTSEAAIVNPPPLLDRSNLRSEESLIDPSTIVQAGTSDADTINHAGPSSQDHQIIPTPYTNPRLKKSLMCHGTHGLLSKIVEVLRKEPTQSTFRFWLCRAIESFLRGRISYADQIFLLRRGLLQHLTSGIINTEHRTNLRREIIQSSFDLLGEIIKFNIDACEELDAILTTEAKLKKTMLLINDNLVDSNMFIRYI